MKYGHFLNRCRRLTRLYNYAGRPPLTETQARTLAARARAHARSRKRPGAHLHYAYPCPCCGHWHTACGKSQRWGEREAREAARQHLEQRAHRRA